MPSNSYRLEIISPEKILFSGNVECSRFPGGKGSFAVLKGHAPLISTLNSGSISWSADGVPGALSVKGGFVEVNNDVVIACVEV